MGQKTIQSGMAMDQINTSHPLKPHEPLEALSKLSQYFDRIAYDKGASMVRMLERMLGADTIRYWSIAILSIGIAELASGNIWNQTCTARQLCTIYSKYSTI